LKNIPFLVIAYTFFLKKNAKTVEFGQKVPFFCIFFGKKGTNSENWTL